MFAIAVRLTMKNIIALLLLALSPLCSAMENVIPNKLVQLMIDSEALSPYWHPKNPERVPLKIIQRHIGNPEGITKFGKNIVLADKAGGFPYFEITGFSISENIWLVSVAYPVEGVTGKFRAEKLPDGKWKLLSASVVEH